MAANIDHEQIYQLILRKQWVELLDVVHRNSKAASLDELLMNAIKTFEDEFFRELDKVESNSTIEILLVKLHLLHKGRTYTLSEDRYERVIVELVKLYKEKGITKEAYDYAKYFPKNEICAEIIKLQQEKSPKIVEHSQSPQIKVTETRNIANIDYTTSLFKSRQELDFFMGVRDVYQMFVVYPNVALSCVIDFNKIKDSLSTEERNFFFKGIIDCVVFDQHDNYRAIRFFELDSFYHDLPEQQLKDSYKDKILALAGQKLYRIRKTLDNQGRAEFMKLVKEIANN